MHELMLLLPFILTLLFSLATVPVLVWMERRIAGLIQNRPGPNRCNVAGFRLGGLIQSVADMMKLVFKEERVPKHIKDSFYFLIAPSIAFVSAFLTFMVIPYADNVTIDGFTYHIQALGVDFSLLWVLAFTGLGVYGIILGGWSSHNKYGLLGSMRASAQVISYEAAMALALISMVLTYNSIDLNVMVQAQSHTFLGVFPSWGVVMQPLAALIFIVTAFAETNRAPFDSAEGESEIVAGYHTEYGAMKFGLYFVAEYIAMAVSGALIVTIFFGGYQLPYLSTEILKENLHYIIIALIIFMPLVAFKFIKWMQKNNTQYDANRRETSVYTKIVTTKIVLFELFLLFGLITSMSDVGQSLGVMTLQIGVFTAKLFMMHFFFIWVRWSIARFRYDQTLDLGWKILLPLSIANVVVTAVVITLVGA